MAQITLKAHEVRKMSDFLRKHNKQSFFLAKDHGAYICATAGKHGTDTFERIIHYFAGCNPEKDENFYDNAAYKFGWDDFGQGLPAQWMHKAAETDGLTKAVLNVTEAGSISFKHYFKRAKVAA